MEKTNNILITQQKNWIDWAKSIGIIMVVMGHSYYAQKDIVPFIFMIHMPLFFFVSGYLFKTNCTLKEISNNNIKRLFVPYILYNLIFAVFALLICIIKSLSCKDVDWNFCFFHGFGCTILGIANGLYDGVTWFLLSLIWCKYILFYFEKSVLWIKLLIVIICGILFYIRIYWNVQYLYSFDTALAGIIWFALGRLERMYMEKYSLPKYILIIIIPICLYLCWSIYKKYGYCNYIMANVNGWMGVIGTATGLIAFFSICKLLDDTNWFIIRRISQSTISIMCWHMLVQGPMDKIIHYQHHLFITFIGDLCIVLLLTSIYPFMQKYTPALIGKRK